MPKLWDATIEAHQTAVRDATLDATAALIGERGLRAVTMSQIAETTGIGRATLYKYFPDVESILRAWHQREIAAHLRKLTTARDQAHAPMARLRAVLLAFAHLSHGPHGHHDAELAALLHRDEQVFRAERDLRQMIRELLVDARAVGDVRDDVAADELASYCLHALGAAGSLPSKVAVGRLVELTVAGLRPQR